MSTTEFSLTYEGAAVEAGQMNVEELAPALLAVGKLLEEANLITNGSEVKLSVQVSARFEKGSFLINLAVNQALLQHNLFTPQLMTQAKTLLELLLGSGGLIGVLRMLKGKKPVVVEKTSSGNVTVRAEDNATVNVTQTVYNFYENPSIRKQVYPMVKPLEREGIDALDVRSGSQQIQRINKADLPALAPTAEEKILLENEYETSLRIVAISFQEDNKWRLSDGKEVHYYAIEDEEFLKKIDQNEPFSKGDLLKVRVRFVVRQMIDGEVKPERSVVSVLDHTPAPKQAKMPPGTDG